MSTNSNADQSNEEQAAAAAADSEAADDGRVSNQDTNTAESSAATSNADSRAETASADTNTAAAPPSTDEQTTGPPTKFQAAIKGGPLKTAPKMVSTLIDETRVHIDESGLWIRAVDPANVGMTDPTLSAAAFESYAATEGLLGVYLERLEVMVRMATKADLVQLTLDQETNKLVIHIDDAEFTMACLDPDSIRDEPDIPDLDLPGEVVLEGRDIDRAVKATDMVCDHITLGIAPDAELFYVTARGDADEVRLELERDDLVDFTAGVAESRFTLEYLRDMNTAIPASADVSLELGEAVPLILAYEFADGDAQVTQMLAPRIEAE